MLIKNEVAPGIVIYDNVINGFGDLRSEIEEGMRAANVEWKDAYIKNSSGVAIDKEIRDVQTITIEKKETGVGHPVIEFFYNNLFTLFEDNFSIVENDYKAS